MKYPKIITLYEQLIGFNATDPKTDHWKTGTPLIQDV